MWWVVDRIEGRYAVLISDDMRQVVLNKGSFRAGRVYWWDGRKLTRSKAEERRRLQDARARLERLSRSDPGGNIVL